MTQKQITVAYDELEYDELDDATQDLVDAARAASYRSYAPYSHFSVGAAIRLDSGEIVSGSNQENVAYPSGLCAERVAAFYAHSRYPESAMLQIAIAARGTDGEFTAEPITPCGACRQVLAEYERLGQHPIQLILVGSQRILSLPSVAALMPLAFDEF